MKSTFLCLTFSLVVTRESLACNYFKSVAGDGVAVVGRDMQFALPEDKFPFNLRTHPKGKVFESPRADGTPGAKWKIKYGYMGADGLHLDTSSDGMNTEGLQCSALYFPNYAEYQTGKADQKNVTLVQTYLCDWVLGTHATVAEVNDTLTNMVVEGITLPGLGMVPLHFAVTDRSGEGIVIEYTQGGKLNIYKNFVGVMTNSPPYDWQMINLGTYAPTMLPTNPKPVNYGGATFGPAGNWASMVGLPGNVQGGSRFVHLAVFLHYAQDKKLIPTAEKGVNLIAHMINVGDQINGTAIAPPTMEDGEVSFNYEGDSSLYSIIYDTKNMKVYIRSYNSFVWQYINMAALDFSAGAEEVVYNIYTFVPSPDVTSNFRPLKI